MEDIEQLSNCQLRRRVDLVRILFQAPQAMILDEPTNHLDLPAKKWLMEELESFPGAILVVSHDLKLLDRSINKVLHLSDEMLHEYKGTYSSFRAQLAADRAGRERASTLEGREIKRLSTLADSMRGSTNRRARIAKSLDKRVERLEGNRTEVSSPRSAPAPSLPPCPPALGGGAARGELRWPSASTTSRCSARSTSWLGGGTASWSSAATGPASRACCAAWPGSKSPAAGRWRSG